MTKEELLKDAILKQWGSIWCEAMGTYVSHIDGALTLDVSQETVDEMKTAEELSNEITRISIRQKRSFTDIYGDKNHD